MILYHGTSSDRLESILSKGIRPRGVRGVRGNWKGWQKSQRGFVYLSSAYPAYFALQSCGKKTDAKPVLLQVEVDEAWLFPDEDFIAAALNARGEGTIPELHERIDLFCWQHEWSKSLAWNGTVACRGVPAANIKGYRVLADFVDALAFGADQVCSPLAHRVCGQQYRHKLDALFGDGTLPCSSCERTTTLDKVRTFGMCLDCETQLRSMKPMRITFQSEGGKS